ncbi:MAG TPA: endoglucanase, partial [Myxococcaceae bacterium]
MHRRLSLSLVSLLLVGLVGVGCGGDEPLPPPPPPPNGDPAISSVTASVPAVDSGATVQLTVSASDPNGDALTYAWTQTPQTPA